MFVQCPPWADIICVVVTYRWPGELTYRHSPTETLLLECRVIKCMGMRTSGRTRLSFVSNPYPRCPCLFSYHTFKQRSVSSCWLFMTLWCKSKPRHVQRCRITYIHLIHMLILCSLPSVAQRITAQGIARAPGWWLWIKISRHYM